MSDQLNNLEQRISKVEYDTRKEYMVLGFRKLPCNPNDYGFNNEADNPYILSFEMALKVKELVDKKLKEDFDNFEATITKLEYLD